MRLHNLDYSSHLSKRSGGIGYNKKASYSRKSNAKKGLYVALASVAGGLAIKTLYDSIHLVEKDHDAIVVDKNSGKRKYVREDEGWFIINPLTEKAIPIHERYGNTTLEQMLQDLEIYKRGKESTALYHVKLKGDADLEKVVGIISPSYMGRHFSVVVIPKIKFEDMGGYDFIVLGVTHEKGNIGINKEFAEGGAWENNPWVYHTIIHENVHHQGSEGISPWGLIINETTVEIISGEIKAEISADGFRQFEAALYEWLEGQALQGSYLRAKEEDRIPFWADRVKEMYGYENPGYDTEGASRNILEKYALLPYVKIKLAMAEGNVVYDLKEYDINQNPEGGEFKIDDLAEFLDNAEKTYGSGDSLKMGLDDLFILQSAKYSTSRK